LCPGEFVNTCSRVAPLDRLAIRRYAFKRSPERMVERYEAVYRSLIVERGEPHADG